MSFVTQYNPSVPNLKNFLMSKWHLIENQPMLREIYREPPLISYRRGKSLKDILVKDLLHHETAGVVFSLSTPFNLKCTHRTKLTPPTRAMLLFHHRAKWFTSVLYLRGRYQVKSWSSNLVFCPCSSLGIRLWLIRACDTGSTHTSWLPCSNAIIFELQTAVFQRWTPKEQNNSEPSGACWKGY